METGRTFILITMIEILSDNSEIITALVTALIGAIIRHFEKRKMKRDLKKNLELDNKK